MLRQQVAVTAGAQPLGAELLRLQLKYCSAAEKKIAVFLIASVLLLALPGHAQSGLNFASAAAYASKVGTEGSNG